MKGEFSMTKTDILSWINTKKIMSIRNIRKAGKRDIQFVRVEEGFILRDKEKIYLYYDDIIQELIQFLPCDDEILEYRDQFIHRILSGHNIFAQIYAFKFPYPLRDYEAHVWLNYNEKQWEEILSQDYAPLLYDFAD